MYKNNRFCPTRRHDSRINVTFGTAEGTKFHVPNFTFLGDIWGFPTQKHEKLPKMNKRPAGDALPSRWCICVPSCLIFLIEVWLLINHYFWKVKYWICSVVARTYIITIIQCLWYICIVDDDCDRLILWVDWQAGAISWLADIICC